jgi:hypothetical protein
MEGKKERPLARCPAADALAGETTCCASSPAPAWSTTPQLEGNEEQCFNASGSLSHPGGPTLGVRVRGGSGRSPSATGLASAELDAEHALENHHDREEPKERAEQQ